MTFNDVWWGAYREAFRMGLIDPLAVRHAWATAYLWYWWGLDEPDRPDIISGYRDPFRQRELLQRWKRGDRAGLAGKPARRSWHTLGRAMDVETDVAGFRAYAYRMERMGVRWGAKFGDTPQFDLPDPKQSPPDVLRFA